MGIRARTRLGPCRVDDFSRLQLVERLARRLAVVLPGEHLAKLLREAADETWWLCALAKRRLDELPVDLERGPRLDSQQRILDRVRPREHAIETRELHGA